MGITIDDPENLSMKSEVSVQLLSLYCKPASKANNHMIAGLLIIWKQVVYITVKKVLATIEKYKKISRNFKLF
jgi:hypothetical protein